MELFTVVQISKGEVIDLRSYGRKELAVEDFMQTCNPADDPRHDGSCVVRQPITIQKIAGQIKTEAKALASRENGKKGGRPRKNNPKNIEDPGKVKRGPAKKLGKKFVEQVKL